MVLDATSPDAQLRALVAELVWTIAHLTAQNALLTQQLTATADALHDLQTRDNPERWMTTP